jgi:hypothetical protein
MRQAYSSDQRRARAALAGRCKAFNGLNRVVERRLLDSPPLVDDRGIAFDRATV